MAKRCLLFLQKSACTISATRPKPHRSEGASKVVGTPGLEPGFACMFQALIPCRIECLNGVCLIKNQVPLPIRLRPH